MISVFLLFYFSVYGGMHAYAWWKLRQAFRPQGPAAVLLVVFLLVMLLGPILSRAIDRPGAVWAARSLAAASYLWMAVIFWLVVLCLLSDAWNILARLSAAVIPAAARLTLPARPAMAVFAALIAAAFLWGLREASDIRLTRLTVKTPLLPPGARPIRVAQISDVHLGLLVGKAKLGKVADLLRRASPDLVVSTGDLVDASITHFNRLAEILAGVRPPMGKLAVTGNHETYAGIEESLAFTRAAGFRVLRGEAVLAGGVL